MRISDWSSDMCSSDLSTRCRINVGGEAVKQHFLDVSEFVGLQHLMDRSHADLVAGSIKVCLSLSFRAVGFAEFTCRGYDQRRLEGGHMVGRTLLIPHQQRVPLRHVVWFKKFI